MKIAWVTSLAALFMVFSACGGDEGGTGPAEGPPAPDASRVHLSFESGEAEIRGEAGAVQASTTVRVENRATEETVEGPADASGAFSLTIAASFGDRLRLRGVSDHGDEGESIDLSIGLLDVGEATAKFFPAGFGHFGLLFSSGEEEHLVAIESAGFYEDVVSVLLSTSTSPQASRAPRPALAAAGRPSPPAMAEARRWSEVRRFVQLHPKPALARAPALRLQAAPAVGSVAPFFVDDGLGNFEPKPATLRFVGAHALVYVDQRIGPALVTDAQVAAAAAQFDPVVYGHDRELFGAESDVDGNERIKILFTPTVNLQGRGVYGFFFALDLVGRDDFEFSNEGEIFYVVAPDPEGVYGWETPSMDELLNTFMPAILAHEFEHMIAMGYRLQNGLELRDIWLEEGWAHLAEWLNGFRPIDEFRTAAFADHPYAAPLISDQTFDEERGASFLLGMYLLDHYGDGVLRASIQDPGIAEDNVESITGRDWTELFHDWALALALDGQTSDRVHDFANLDPREIFTRLKAGDPETFTHDYLDIEPFDVADLNVETPQLGSTTRYLRVVSSDERNIAEVEVSAPRRARLGVGIARTR